MCGVCIADLGVNRTSCCVRLKTRHSVKALRLIEKRRGRGGNKRRGKRRRGSNRGRERGRSGREKKWDLYQILHMYQLL